MKKLSLFALTWPIFIELFLHMLMGSTDTFMLAHLSEEAVAAVGVANQLVHFTILLFSMVAAGTTVLVSQYLGAERPREASQVSAISITLNLAIGIVVSLCIIGWRESFLNLFHLQADVSELADIYLLIVGGTIFSQALIVTVSAILRSYGYTRDAMLVSIAMNVIHVIGNYLFIFGALGVPQLGVTGVALSTAASRVIAVIFILILLYYRLPSSIEWKDYLDVRWTLVKPMLRIGIPSAGEQLSYNTAQMMLTAFVTILGTTALATRVFTMNIVAFILLIGLAMGQGTQIIIGHLVGAGRTDEAYRRLIHSLRWSFLVTIAAVLAAAWFREPLMSIFTDNPDIISLGGTLLLICILLEPGRTLNLVIISSLRAAGDAKFPVVVGIFSTWGISVPLFYYLGIHLGYGLVGMWVAIALDEWLRGIIMYWRWRSRVWEKKKLIDEPQDELVASG